jgi:serine/threonine-protein kinase PknG
VVTAPTHLRCTRPDCDGTGHIDVDGCCDVCGRQAPTRRPTGPPTPRASAEVIPLHRGRAGSQPPPSPSGLSEASGQLSASFGVDYFGLPRISRSRAGAGLVQVPELAESLRFCGRCASPVGRGDSERPGRPEGVCEQCGQPYSFVAKLRVGELVGGRYEVLGCIAHGGQGWVYKAVDRNLSDDEVTAYVALKGLLDSAGPDFRRATEAERRFLTTVRHPNIVRVLDYVSHGSPDGQRTDYIVMEYVDGVSLAEHLRQLRADTGTGSLEPADGIRHMLRLLPALRYLHNVGLAFCDLKPDNLIATPDRNLMLVDLGGARHLDDPRHGVLSTPGFRAPEIDDAEYRPAGMEAGRPSVASDLFAVGRTLAVLVLGHFPGLLDVHRHTLPDPAAHPVLREHESLDRLLRKATAERPDRRFASAQLLAEALVGVLRDVTALTEARAVPARSQHFGAAFHPTGEDPAGRRVRPEWLILPAPLVSQEDPAAPALAAVPETPSPDRIPLLESLPQQTVEARLMTVRACLEAGPDFHDRCGAALAALAAGPDADWRVDWYGGLLALARDEPADAVAAFDRAWSEIPGELTARLALAIAAEAAGDPARAAALYDVVSRADPTVTCAAFGLARCQPTAPGRMEAYRRVRESALAYGEARIRLILLLVESPPDGAPELEALLEAAEILEGSPVDRRRTSLLFSNEQRLLLRRDILAGALRLEHELVAAGEPVPAESVLGEPLRDRPLRLALEDTYRRLARLTPDPADRIQLVNEANRVRPRTTL